MNKEYAAWKASESGIELPEQFKTGAELPGKGNKVTLEDHLAPIVTGTDIFRRAGFFDTRPLPAPAIMGPTTQPRATQVQQLTNTQPGPLNLPPQSLIPLWRTPAVSAKRCYSDNLIGTGRSCEE